MHQNNKTSITILQLMTHTSGFDADPVPPLYPKWVRVRLHDTLVTRTKGCR
jgi:CubicO group peptidase (beta-lactamase class C family)